MFYLKIFFSSLCFAVCLCACTQAPAEVVLHTPGQGSAIPRGVDILAGPTHTAIAVEKVVVADVAPLVSAPTHNAESFDVAWVGNAPAPAPKTAPAIKVTSAPAPVILTAEPPAVPETETIAIGDALTLSGSPVDTIPPLAAVPTYKPEAPTKKTFISQSFIWPVKGQVVSRFGSKPGGRQNDGINIAAPEGTPVVAVADGEVVYAGDELRGYGHLLLIRHAGEWVSAYAHSQSFAVKSGDRVQQGDTVAYVGQTGNVSAPQLHFALRRGKTTVNPERHLPTMVGLAR